MALNPVYVFFLYHLALSSDFQARIYHILKLSDIVQYALVDSDPFLGLKLLSAEQGRPTVPSRDAL